MAARHRIPRLCLRAGSRAVGQGIHGIRVAENAAGGVRALRDLPERSTVATQSGPARARQEGVGLMEIPIDEDFVGAILAQEYAQAREEIRTVGALDALRNSQRRHDARIAAAPDIGTLDCRAGCTWCCHFSVDVRAVEVFGALEF